MYFLLNIGFSNDMSVFRGVKFDALKLHEACKWFVQIWSTDSTAVCKRQLAIDVAKQDIHSLICANFFATLCL